MELTQQQQVIFRQLQQDVEYHLRCAQESQEKIKLMLTTLGLQSVNFVLLGVPMPVQNAPDTLPQPQPQPTAPGATSPLNG